LDYKAGSKRVILSLCHRNEQTVLRKFVESMVNLCAPENLKQWARRLLAPRAFGIVLILTTLGGTELRFDWVEQSVGAYLATTNAYRPESGTVWDQGHQTEQARQALSQYMSQRQNVQMEARRATSLGQVVSGITDERGAMISAEHFVELFLALPPVISHEIISPFTLLAQLSSGQWQRTFFERQDQQLSIYLLDNQNQVLHRLVVGSGLLEHILRGEVAVSSSLAGLSDFANHIYPAQRFFELLNSYPEAVRQGILAHPDDLLHISGRIVRVGISDRVSEDVIDLGFEVEGTQGLKVILTQGNADDVRRLQRALEGRTRFGWSLLEKESP
jgi:hypothetical protein